MQPSIQSRELVQESILNLITAVILLIPAFVSAAEWSQFSERIDLGLIECDSIREASGIAASAVNPDVLYIHNDSGDMNVIYAINTKGEHLGVFTIRGCEERDWEDIAVGPGPDPGESYVYVANIGDNDAVYDYKYIYRFPEPAVDANREPLDETVHNAETITVQLPGGPRDAETLMVDPLTRDLYLVSKREPDVLVYRLNFPQSTTEINIPEPVATLRLFWIVGGDISPSGNEILVKSGDAVFYYRRQPGESIAGAFRKSPRTIAPYIPEPQGEAICWKPDGKGFYTVSEERNDIPCHLYFYQRIE